MATVPRSLESLIDELAEINKHRRRLENAIVEHPDSRVDETLHQTTMRISGRRIDEALAQLKAQQERRRAAWYGERHLRLVES